MQTRWRYHGKRIFRIDDGTNNKKRQTQTSQSVKTAKHGPNYLSSLQLQQTPTNLAIAMTQIIIQISQ